jgi:hypothetical protein
VAKTLQLEPAPEGQVAEAGQIVEAELRPADEEPQETAATGTDG